MYLIFFWVKREKTNKQKKTSVLGEGTAGRRQTHTSHEAQLVYFPRRAVPPHSGLGAPSAGGAGAGMRGGGIQVEGVQGFKAPRLLKLPLPTLLSILSAH